MRTKTKVLSLVLSALFVSILASAQVTSDFDKEADFTKYKLYNFAGWVDGSDKILNELDKKRILDAFGAEFDKRGMTHVDEEGDITVTLFIVLDQKTSKSAYTNYTGGMGYGGRMGYGYGAYGMGGSSTTTIEEYDYVDGTMIIDIYDNTTKKLVWQAIWKSEVNDNPKKRDKRVPKNVKKLMKTYPVKPVKK